jgi:signal transduction histidine kinase
MGVKQKSLRRVFTGFILRIGLEMLIGGVLLAAIFIAAMFFGLIIPANFSEQYANDVMEKAGEQEYARDVIPEIGDFVTYYLTDDSGNVTQSNRSWSVGKPLREEPKSGLVFGQSYYVKKAFPDGTLYLEYYMRTSYPSGFLNRYFISPEYVLAILAFIMMLLIVILNVRRMEKLFKKELRPLGEAAEQISIDNLDVNIAPSSITEVQRVEDSFLKMKDELADSLGREWQAQRNQRAQIAALAHDLKTPLTVILGNLDLLSETDITDDQHQMIETSIGEVKHSEDYIGILVDMARNTGEVEIKRAPVALQGFFGNIESKALVLCENRQVRLKTSYQFSDASYSGDRDRIERAVMNLISNAIDYSPEDEAVELSAACADGTLTITVRDHGEGFPAEMLKSGVGLFKMGESSRSSKKHYGIGLYMAENTAKLHNGSLAISNCADGGAEVKMVLE